MAKQVVGPVERHFEKFVVGIAGVLLLGVVAKYLVTSPNKMDLGGGESVAPTAVDAALASKAQDVSARIRSGRSSVEVPEPIFDEFVSAVDPFAKSDLKDQWPVSVPIQPEVPIVDPPDIVLGVQRLAQVVRMPRPSVTFGRSTLRFEDDSDRDIDSFLITNWATVSSLFDRAAQAKQFSDTYGATNSQVDFAGVDIQRRTMKPDGSWDDLGWEDIKPWPAAELETSPPTLELERDNRGRLDIQKELYNRLQDYVTDLSLGVNQIEIIRPLFAQIVNGDEWSFPQLSAYKNVLIQDDELLYPDEASPYPDDRYRLEKSPVTRDTPKADRMTPQELIQAGKEKLQNAKSKDDATRAYNDFFSVKEHPNATAQERIEAQRWAKQAEQMEKDFERKDKFNRNRPQAGGKAAPKKKRERLPHQQLWAHDAIKGSIEAGRTYQYRIRAVLLNVLAGEPSKFDDPNLGLIVLLRGPWSEPSDPVAIQDTIRYFVTSFNERRKQVSVEFYQWWDGVWVKNRDVFTVGQKLAKEARADVPDISNPTQADHTEVQFSADATVMEIDFKRSYRDISRAASRQGVAYGSPSEMCSVVLLGSNGELHERFVPSDKANPEKTVYAAKVWKAPQGSK